MINAIKWDDVLKYWNWFSFQNASPVSLPYASNPPHGFNYALWCSVTQFTDPLVYISRVMLAHCDNMSHLKEKKKRGFEQTFQMKHFVVLLLYINANFRRVYISIP